MVATIVAISHQALNGQELTKEQLVADLLRQKEQEDYLQSQLEQIAIREATLTDADKLRITLNAIARAANPIPTPPNPVIQAIKRLKSTSTITASSSLTESGGMQMMALIGGGGGMQPMSLTGDGEGGVDNVPPFSNFGIAPLTQWQTDPNTTGNYPWFQESNSYSTNKNISSYDFPMPANTSSKAWTILTNHYDLNGDPRAHEMRIVYEFNHSGGDSFQVRLGNPASSPLITLPMTGVGVLKTNILTLPRFVGTNLNVYFIVFRNANISFSPRARLYSVQWQTYSGPVTNALKFTQVSTNVTKLSWSALNQQTNHWYLAYASSVLGPWASNTVPITYSNWQASVNFTNSFPQRVYQLRYYWPGYH